MPARNAHSARSRSRMSLPKYANAKTSPVAEIHFVRIQLENFLLGEALLEFERNHGFGELPAPRALVRKEERPRHLHRDGAGALVVLAAVPQVRPGGPCDAHKIESAVLEEALVLR